MKKKNIVQKKEEFNDIIRKTKPYKNKYLYIYIRKSNFNYPRFGISIPKKYGIAVERNKIKRQLKEIIDSNQILFKNNLDYIIIVRDQIKFQKYSEIEKIIRNIFDDINTKRCINEE